MLRKLKFPFTFRESLYGSVTAILLILSHPTADLGLLAWGSLIPFFIILRTMNPRQAFGYGFFVGVVCYGVLFYWFINMSRTAMIPLPLAILAAVSLVLYVSLYFALFAWGAVRFRGGGLLDLLAIPSWWVILEWIRDRFCTGFGWAMLGHTQYLNLPVIQIADVTGVFGVSFMVVLVNLALSRAWFEDGPSRCRAVGPLGIAVVVIFLVLSYGWARLKQYPTGASLKVAVVQGNIPQEVKWDPQLTDEFMDRHLRLTEKAMKDEPDLVIWPETSFPGYLWERPDLYRRLRNSVEAWGRPLMFGVVTKEGDEFYNSAILLGPDGSEVKRHAKIHLVPFGEFIPLRKQLPFISDLIPIGDFTPGKELTRFSVAPETGLALSVLICFEDTVARVARRFVRAGAGILVNITNDAWFGDSRAPYQHLQSAVFRTVETRRPLIRAANTGVSALIDTHGRIERAVTSADHQRTGVEGVLTVRAYFGEKITPYTKYGDVFTYFCFGCILLVIGYKNRISKGL